MRLVRWTDNDNQIRYSYVRDEDSDSLAPYGIPAVIPDLKEELDWDSILAEMQAELAELGLVNWRAFQHNQHSVHRVLAPVKRAVINLYRQKSKEA